MRRRRTVFGGHQLRVSAASSSTARPTSRPSVARLSPCPARLAVCSSCVFRIPVLLVRPDNWLPLEGAPGPVANQRGGPAPRPERGLNGGDPSRSGRDGGGGRLCRSAGRGAGFKRASAGPGAPVQGPACFPCPVCGSRAETTGEREGTAVPSLFASLINLDFSCFSELFY